MSYTSVRQMLALFVLAVTVGGCGTRDKDCRDVLAAGGSKSSEISKDISRLTPGATSAKGLHDIGKKTTDLAAAVEAVAIKDPKVIAGRARYVEGLRATADSIEKAAAAMGSHDEDTVVKLLGELKADALEGKATESTALLAAACTEK